MGEGKAVRKGKWPLIALAAMTVVLIMCGSFWDREISQLCYLGELPSENLFGIVFAFIGVIPTFVGWSFLGAGILALSNRQIDGQKARRRLAVLAGVLFVLSFLFFCNTLQFVNESAFPVHPALAYGVGTLTIAAAAALGHWCARRSDNPDLLKQVLLLTAVSLIVMVVVMGTKELMSRPRFRFVMEMSDMDCFRNWWQSGRDIKAALPAGSSGDDFSSFPSGHAAYAMFAVLLFPAMADYFGKLDPYRPLLLAFGILWWACTAFSRITTGAHYLSDVAFSGLITIAAYGGVLARRRWAAASRDPR